MEGPSLNDLGSDLNSNDTQRKKISFKTYLTIGALSIACIGLIILLIILLINSSESSNKEESTEIIGEIKCIFEITTLDKNTTKILGDEFIKSSKFSIIIDEKKIDKYIKEYTFDEIGFHNITFQLFENINMDYMFKGVTNLITIQMKSKKQAKIFSLISTFEDCKSLNTITISGFNTSEVTSMKKLFYNSHLSNLNLNITTNSLQDISYMFAGTNLDRINFKELIFFTKRYTSI